MIQVFVLSLLFAFCVISFSSQCSPFPFRKTFLRIVLVTSVAMEAVIFAYTYNCKYCNYLAEILLVLANHVSESSKAVV